MNTHVRVCFLKAAILATLMSLGPRPHLARGADVISRFYFGESNEGFTNSDDNLKTWKWGAPTKSSIGATRGNVWATELDIDYPQNADSTLRSPLMDLVGYAELTLTIFHYYQIDTDGNCEPETWNARAGSCGDGGFVRLDLDDGTKLTIEPDGGYDAQIVYGDEVIPAFGGDLGDWSITYFDLLEPDLGNVRLELVFVSNSTERAEGWFIEEIVVYEGDAIPPRVELTRGQDDTSNVTGPYYIEVEATDNREVDTVTLHYLVDEGEYTATEMDRLDGTDIWQGKIPGQETGTVVQYYVHVTDSSGNSATYPADLETTGVLIFRVRLPPPMFLEFDYSDNVPPEVATDLALVWMPPRPGAIDTGEEDVPLIVDYQIVHTVLNDGEEVSSSISTDLDGEDKDRYALVEAAGYPYSDRYTVRARYQVRNAYGEYELVPGDLSLPRETTVYVPRIMSVSTGSVVQGTEVNVDIVGEYTTFVQGDVTVSLGRGIDVLEVRVESVTRCSALARLSPDVPLGSRDLNLSWSDISLKYPDAVEILDKQILPRIEEIVPAQVRRREEKEIKFIGANTDFNAETLDVAFGPDIELLGLEVLSATELAASIWVEQAAETGPRDVYVYTGDDVLLVDLEILPAQTTTFSLCFGCNTAGAAAGNGSLLILAFAGMLFRWRRRASDKIPLRGDYAEHRLAPELDNRSGCNHNCPSFERTRREYRQSEA